MSPENLEKNKVLLERVKTLADKKNCSLNQLALAWVIHKGPDVVGIPGTTKKAPLFLRGKTLKFKYVSKADPKTTLNPKPY